MCRVLIYNLFGKTGCHCRLHEEQTTPFGGEFAAAGECWSLCSWVSTSDEPYERLQGMHLRNNTLCPFLPRLSTSLKSVFMLPVHQLLGTSGGVAFREHSGRQEESDRALLGSPLLRCRPHRQPGKVAQSDKCVSTVAALPETGRGLT